MRHRVHGRKLGRTSAHRKAMFRNQLTALFLHERITTTVAKAKELRPLAEKMVTLARTGTLANRRRVVTMVSDKQVVKRLFDEIGPRFVDRNGGYTRILRIGRRHGDCADMAIIEFVDYQPKEKGEVSGGSDKESLMDRAKGLFGGGRGDGADAKAEVASAEEVVEETPEVVAEVDATAETADDVVETEDIEVAEAEAEPEEAEKKD